MVDKSSPLGVNTINALAIRFAGSGYTRPADFLENVVSVDDVRSARRYIPIDDNGEGLRPISESILLKQPHPYQSLGAPYTDYSPWYLRETVVQKLVEAQARLNSALPNSRLLVFDGFRPRAVQQFMVEHECSRLAKSKGFSNYDEADAESRERIQRKVLQFWAPAAVDPTAPSPHATGAALDLTIVGPDGVELPMGSAVDELVPASLPSYFKDKSTAQEQTFHANRELLRQVMEDSGFRRLPTEWWHFSYGDQMWALIKGLDDEDANVRALYGGL